MRFFTPEILDNPYPLYEQWRAHHPIWQDEETGAWILSRFDDVRHVLKHSSDFSSKAMGGGETGPLPLLTDDAPRHTELRNIVNKAFTTRMLKEIEDEVADIARSLVDGIPEGESVDVVEALTIPLPVAVISKMMGIPSERAQDFKRWSDALTGTLAGASLAEREVEIGEMYAFFQSLIPERRNQGGSDLVSAVVNASVDGKQLSDHDVVGFCMLLLIAGNETTTNLLGNFLNVLADRPQSWQQLRTQPKLIEQGIEETLRFDGPVQFLKTYADLALHISWQSIGARRCGSRHHGVSEPRRVGVLECESIRPRERKNSTSYLRLWYSLLYWCSARAARGEGRDAGTHRAVHGRWSGRWR